MRCATVLSARSPGPPAGRSTGCGREGSPSSTTGATSGASSACPWTPCGARRSWARSRKPDSSTASSSPRPASLQNLLRVHTPEYLHAVQEPEALTRILGVDVPAREVETTLDLQRLM